MKRSAERQNTASKLKPSSRAVGYFRASTNKDLWERLEENRAYDKRIQEEVERLELACVGTQWDEPIPVVPTERAGFATIRAMLSAGLADTLVCYSIAHLSRFAAEVSWVLAFCLANGIRVIFIDDHIDTGEASGRLLALAFAGMVEEPDPVANLRFAA